MRRWGILCAVVALGAASYVASPATADPPADAAHLGGCRYNAVSQSSVTGTDHFRGTVEAYVVGYSPTPAHNPVTVIALRCELSVNGVVMAIADGSAAGPVGVLPPTPIAYDAGNEDPVDFCTYLTLVDAHGQVVTWTECEHEPAPIPPPDDRDRIEQVLELVNGVWAGDVDPVACPILAALAPVQVQDALVVTPEGDVYVAGDLVYDCPPYETA